MAKKESYGKMAKAEKMGGKGGGKMIQSPAKGLSKK